MKKIRENVFSMFHRQNMNNSNMECLEIKIRNHVNMGVVHEMG